MTSILKPRHVVVPIAFLEPLLEFPPLRGAHKSVSIPPAVCTWLGIFIAQSLGNHYKGTCGETEYWAAVW